MAQLPEYPLISLVMPSYNQGRYLENTILSVLGQQYPNLEILVMDGGSQDQSVEIIRRYESHFVHWQSCPDKGQADAINQGFARSRGDILCWLNSDDMLMPGTLLEIGRHLARRTHEPALVYGGMMIIDDISEKMRCSSINGEPFDRERLTHLHYVPQPSAYWTRPLWEQVGPLNIDYHYVLDWDWFIRASKIVDFEYVSKFYSICRYHPGHKTSSGGEVRRKEVLEMVRTYASPYWIRIFEEVENHFDSIRRKRKYLFSRKLSQAHNKALYRQRFRSVMGALQNPNDPNDLYHALIMYGA